MKKSASLKHFTRIFSLLTFGFVGITLSGCQTDDQLRTLNQQQAQTIESLQSEVARLNAELEEILMAREDLARAKAELEAKLKSELASGDMEVSMQDRGLVVTMLDRVLFDSGKAELKSTSKSSLSKVADVLDAKLEKNMIYVEGHTDNQPIRHSTWRSNWELSTSRATEVIHYFIEEMNFSPARLAATGYGEFQPVADNATTQGRMKNRRVEIIISPRKLVAPAANVG